jgi:hypothetical protein
MIRFSFEPIVIETMRQNELFRFARPACPRFHLGPALRILHPRAYYTSGAGFIWGSSSYRNHGFLSLCE